MGDRSRGAANPCDIGRYDSDVCCSEGYPGDLYSALLRPPSWFHLLRASQPCPDHVRAGVPLRDRGRSMAETGRAGSIYRRFTETGIAGLPALLILLSLSSGLGYIATMQNSIRAAQALYLLPTGFLSEAGKFSRCPSSSWPRELLSSLSKLPG